MIVERALAATSSSSVLPEISGYRTYLHIILYTIVGGILYAAASVVATIRVSQSDHNCSATSALQLRPWLQVTISGCEYQCNSVTSATLAAIRNATHIWCLG